MPIRTIELKSRLTWEERLQTWFLQLKKRKLERDRDELLAQGKMRPERLP